MRGHLRKRNKNSWSIVLDAGRDPTTGRRKQQWVSVKGTRKEAERKLMEMIHQVETGAFVKPTRLTFGAFLQGWYRDYVSTHLRSGTAEGYEGIIRVHLLPNLGHVPLSRLQPSHLQAYYANALASGRRDRKTGGLSAKTVLQHHSVIRRALNHAVRWGLVIRNVAQAVDPPRPEYREMRSLDSDGVDLFLQAARDTVYHPLFHLDIYTGLSRSELLGLRWKDVDLMMSSLSVVQVLHRLSGGRLVFEEPKAVRRRRAIALTPTSVVALREHRARVKQEKEVLGVPLKPEALVFAHPNGSPMLPSTVSHAFTRIARKAGLQGLRLHDLRHTHASLMLRQGVHPKIIQERLGHATISTTMDIYSHVLPGMQQEAAKKFDEGLRQGTRNTGIEIAG